MGRGSHFVKQSLEENIARDMEGQFLLNNLGGEGVGDVTSAYKTMAAKVLGELEASLGRGLPEEEQFMFVHGTAECR